MVLTGDDNWKLKELLILRRWDRGTFYLLIYYTIYAAIYLFECIN